MLMNAFSATIWWLTTFQALDLDEPPKSCSTVLVFSSQPSRLDPPATQLNALQTFNGPPQHHASSPSIVTEPSDTRPSTPSINIVHQQPQPPSTYVQPGISPVKSSSQQEMQSGSSQNHNFFQTTTAGTSISRPPPTSQSPGPISSSGRKQRCTMGPRADCLKCRMGVKGHWMHFETLE